MGMLVSTVVVEDEMQVQTCWELSIQSPQERQELLIAMTRHAIGDDGSFQYIQRSEQGRGSMPFVVMRHRSATPFLHRQAGLGSIQCLNLTLLVHANDQRFIGRIQIQAHNVSQFLHKLRIARQLKLAHSMWLQPVGIPDALNRRRTRAAMLGHRPTAPVSRALRFAVQRRVDNPLDLAGRYRRFSAAPFLNLSQTRWASSNEAFAPHNTRWSADFHVLSNPVVGESLCSHQNNPTPRNNTLRSILGTDPDAERALLVGRNRKFFGGFPHSRHNTPESGHCKAICETVH